MRKPFQMWISVDSAQVERSFLARDHLRQSHHSCWFVQVAMRLLSIIPMMLIAHNQDATMVRMWEVLMVSSQLETLHSMRLSGCVGRWRRWYELILRQRLRAPDRTQNWYCGFEALPTPPQWRGLDQASLWMSWYSNGSPTKRQRLTVEKTSRKSFSEIKNDIASASW